LLFLNILNMVCLTVALTISAAAALAERPALLNKVLPGGQTLTPKEDYCGETLRDRDTETPRHHVHGMNFEVSLFPFRHRPQRVYGSWNPLGIIGY
jgi:hypothetical protein